MRTLKFRAYDSATGKVSEPFDVKERWGDYLIDFEDYSTDGALDSIIWEQFTGLLDRNGKEIFEGDLVAYEKNNIASVRFEYGGFYPFVEPYNDFGCPSGKEVEVIGNIHESNMEEE